MFISELFAAGFRCFGVDNALTLKLRRRLNILVGPNDAGKTAIIDAPRYVLWTRGDEFVRLDPNDFHANTAGHRASELLRKAERELRSGRRSRLCRSVYIHERRVQCIEAGSEPTAPIPSVLPRCPKSRGEVRAL